MAVGVIGVALVVAATSTDAEPECVEKLMQVADGTGSPARLEDAILGSLYTFGYFEQFPDVDEAEGVEPDPRSAPRRHHEVTLDLDGEPRVDIDRAWGGWFVSGMSFCP